MLKILLLCMAFSVQAQAFVTSCITYDVDNVHPDDVRVSMFVKCMRKGDTLWVDGGIDPYLIDELRTYNDVPIKTIYLNSEGGRVEDAFELSHFIRKNKIKTIVRKEALCASACTLLFSAGTNRVAHEEARFMIHSARNLFIDGEKKTEINECLEKPNDACMAHIKERKSHLLAVTHKMFDMYEDHGVTIDLRQDYFALPLADDWLEKGNFVGIIDWWLTPQQLVPYNFVTKILN